MLPALFREFLLQVLVMTLTQVFFLLIEQFFDFHIHWFKFFLEVLLFFKETFAFCSDLIERCIPSLTIFINAILHHRHHLVISVIVIIFQRLCNLFDYYKKVISRVCCHECLPHWESKRFNYRNALEDVLDCHIHQTIIFWFQVLILLNFGW